MVDMVVVWQMATAEEHGFIARTTRECQLSQVVDAATVVTEAPRK